MDLALVLRGMQDLTTGQVDDMNLAFRRDARLAIGHVHERPELGVRGGSTPRRPSRPLFQVARHQLAVGDGVEVVAADDAARRLTAQLDGGRGDGLRVAAAEGRDDAGDRRQQGERRQP